MANRSQFRRAVMGFVTAVAVSALQGGAARGAATSVVISQVYGGGGGSTSVIKNDFIELYNMSGSDVDLTGYSIQYASATGTSWQVSALSGTIKAGSYFLVQESGGSVGAALPAPDATGTLSMGATSGKVALVNGTTALTDASFDGAAPNGTGPSIVDFVGFGSANRYEGSGAVAALSTSTAALRAGNPRGVTDTDVNSADFTAGAPDPRNSSWVPPTSNPPVVSNIAFTPPAVDPGGSSTLTATVTPGTNPTVSSVTADLTPIGAGTLSLTNTSGTTWSGTVNVPSAASAGSKDIVVTATDAAGQTGTAHGTLTVNTIGGPLTVAQLRTKTPDASTVYTARGIITANSVNANGAYMEDADGAAGVMLFGATAINAAQPKAGDDVTATGTLQYYNGATEFAITALTVNSSGNAVPAPAALTIPQAEQIGPAPAYDHPKEGLLVSMADLTVDSVTNGGSNAVLKDASGNTIALYIYKNATSKAVTPYPGVPANPIDAATIVVGNRYNVTGILAYYKTGSTGSGTDPAGFEILPRNGDDLILTGQSVITSAVVDPAIVARGAAATITVVTNPVEGSTVTADLSAFGGSATQPLSWDGSGAYTCALTVPANAPLGAASVTVTASNPSQSGGLPLTARPAFTIITQPATMTIAEARVAPEYTGVILSGTVTHSAPGPAGTFYLQDATGGVYFFDSKQTVFSGIPGDGYTVQGFKTTYQGSVEINYTGQTPVFGSGAAISPASCNQAGWPSVEGKLATTPNLIITGTRSAGTNKVFEVTDGTSTGEIFIAAANTYITSSELAAFTTGTAWVVTGVVDRYTSGTMDVWQIKPRLGSDLTAGTAPALVPAKLAFTTQPGSGTPGGPISPSPVLTIQTAAGATVTTFTGPVTVALKSGTGASGAVLSGQTTVSAVNGIASLGTLAIDTAGTGYVLTATSGWLPALDSTAFNVGSPAVPGDVDKSGAVDANDVLLALKIAGGLVSASDPSVSQQNGDVTGDGAITSADAVKIRRMF